MKHSTYLLLTENSTRVKSLKLILSCLLLALSGIVFGQEAEKNRVELLQLARLHEKVTIFTDRTIYSVGEEIRFCAHCSNNTQTNANISSVLYLELISADGNSFVQMKYPLQNNKTSGKVFIPENWLTGKYFLKAYTKWMRNFSPESYAYQPVTIVNPSNSDVLQSNDTGGNELVFKSEEQTSTITIQTDKAVYSPREKVNVSVRENGAINKLNSYCVSVVKKGAKNISKCLAYINEKETPTTDAVEYYPEINGICLSGKVMDESHKEPVKDALVRLAVLGDVSYFFTSSSNENGEFFIKLPDNENTSDIFIDAVKDDLTLTVDLDKDFCERPVKLKSGEFYLSEEEKEMATEISINAQINQTFKVPVDLLTAEEENSSAMSFYGTPDRTVYTETYINLQTVQDFIFEIITEVKYENKRLVPSFNSGRLNSLSSLPYLVMVDNIPITDEPAFMDIELSKIERIELNNYGYVVGNTRYCGVINAFTKNNDMAGIDLPKNSMFFTYALMEDNKNRVESNVALEKHIPDRRNCLYWNPDLKLNMSEKQFSFFTTDVPGNYEIIVQGIAKDGCTPVYFSKDFLVE